MNREFKSTSSVARSVFAAAAAVVTLGLAGFIDGLATHYASNGASLIADHVVASTRA